MIGVSVVSGSRRVVGRVLADGQWEGGIWFFLLGTAHHGCRFVSVFSWLVAGWLVSLSAFALAGVKCGGCSGVCCHQSDAPA